MSTSTDVLPLFWPGKDAAMGLRKVPCESRIRAPNACWKLKCRQHHRSFRRQLPTRISTPYAPRVDATDRVLTERGYSNALRRAIKFSCATMHNTAAVVCWPWQLGREIQRYTGAVRRIGRPIHRNSRHPPAGIAAQVGHRTGAAHRMEKTRTGLQRFTLRI